MDDDKPCPDGVLRHSIFIALDCPRCHPENREECLPSTM